MLCNLEKFNGFVEFKVLLVVVLFIYNIVDEFKVEGDWEVFVKYVGFEFDDVKLKEVVCIKYDNIFYLECFGCNLCMGN